MSIFIENFVFDRVQSCHFTWLVKKLGRGGHNGLSHLPQTRPLDYPLNFGQREKTKILFASKYFICGHPYSELVKGDLMAL